MPKTAKFYYRERELKGTSTDVSQIKASGKFEVISKGPYWDGLRDEYFDIPRTVCVCRFEPDAELITDALNGFSHEG